MRLLDEYVDCELFKWKKHLASIWCFYNAVMVSDNIGTYANLGGINAILSAAMKFFTGWVIAGGESIGQVSNWVDIRKCGRPWLEFEILTTNYGAFNLRAIVDYGRPVGNQMMQIRQQTFNMSGVIEYSPETNIRVMDLSRAYGGYIRLRTVDNTGEITCTVSCKGPGSFKTYDGS
jgi:hypothetical protein